MIFVLEHSTVACNITWEVKFLKIGTGWEVGILKVGTGIKESEELELVEQDMERDRC